MPEYKEGLYYVPLGLGPWIAVFLLSLSLPVHSGGYWASFVILVDMNHSLGASPPLSWAFVKRVKFDIPRYPLRYLDRGHRRCGIAARN